MESVSPNSRLVKVLFILFIFGYQNAYTQCSITGLDPDYCIDDPAVTLTGTPGGGTFSGPGMTGATFDPGAAGVGVHTIEYSLPGDEDKYYIKSNIGNPWGSTSNQTAMNNAFGPGGWIQESFETADAATVFASTTSFVFLEGSDGHASELNTFLVANLALIETWVDEGGCLLLNAAPNEGGDINFGFGGTTLDYPVFSSAVTVVDAAHPAILGPMLPTTTAMTGPYYAHGRILGAGYTNVVVSGANVVLAEKGWGLGTVMVGGMTTANWHSPTPHGTNFRANLLTYLNSLAVTTSCLVTQDVEVHDLPAVTASADITEVCEGEMVTLTGGGADTYVWDGGATDGVAFAPPIGTTTYTVTGTNTTTTCDNTATIDITVNPNPVVTAAVTAPEICLGESVTFTGGGADSYVWDGGVTDGVPFTPAAAGTFTYTVTGTNTATGCQETASVDVTIYDNPTVTATATPDEICIGESVTFTGGGAETYVWDGGATDGVPFTPAASGTFTFNVTGSVGATGCENTASVDILVHDLPTVTASADITEVCEGEMVTLTGGGADTYVWDGGATDGVAFAPPTGTTTYTVTGTNTTTTCDNTATIDITVNPNPVVTAAVTAPEICLGESVTFTGGGADSYVWDGGVTDGVPFTPAAAGTFTYTVTGTNTATGCQETASVDVTIYDNPTVTATATPDEICIGESVTFTGGGAETYVWDGGATDGVPFTPAASGTFTFNVTGSVGATGCENTASVDILVHDLPTVTASADVSEVCEGEMVTLTGGGADTYVWDGGATDGVAFAPPTGTTTYTVTGTNTTTTCDNTATIDITVNPNPVVTAAVTAPEICLGESVTFTGGGADSYVWDGGVTDGVPFTPAAAGTFTYTVTGTNTATGCQETASVDVTIYDNPTVTATATPDEICIGESVTFTGGGAETYVWDGGATDGVPFTPAASGTFTFNVTGSVGATGCENTASVDILVHDLPTVTASADVSEVCEGEMVTLTGGGADTYVWDGGATDGVAFAPPTGTTTYTVTGTNTTTTCDNTATIDITVNPNPVVTAAVTAPEICLGESVTFTGGGADSYVWDGGVTDGVPFTPAAAGTFTYTVTGTNTATGCQETASVDVTIYDNPTVTATATPDEICIGESVTFTGGGAETYVWDGGVTDGVPFTPDASGSYTFNVVGSVGGSGCEGTASVDIEVHDLPEVTASADTDEICEGESITFAGGGADSFIWDLGVTDGVPFNPPVGTTTYTVIGTDAATGCENTANITVTVNPNPVVSAMTSESEICLGESIVLTGSGATTYTWEDGISDGVPHTPESAGTFTYTVLGTSDAGCSGSATVEVTVIECEGVLADFCFDNNICVGDCIDFTDNSLGTIASYSWDFGPDASPTTSSEANPTVCFPTVGVYDISLTITNINGTTSTLSQTLTVNEIPVVTAAIDTIIEGGGQANLIANSDWEGTYIWSPSDDVDCFDCQVTWASPQDSTTFTVLFTDQNGCQDQASVFVLVNFANGIGVPSAFSPNNDGVNDILFVKGYNIESLQFLIFNRYGELIFKSDNQNLGWDGYFQNREENPGVFTWVVHYKLTDGKRGKIKGNTTLIR